MKFDYHTHHYRCGHAKGDIRDYIETAIERGLQILGISDHSPWFYREDAYSSRIVMPKEEFSHYVNEVLELKKEYENQIEVLLGVESDFVPSHLQLYQSVYEQYPFDYIIGSVHATNNMSIFNRDRWKNLNEKQLLLEKELYFNLIEQSARSGMFEILGHIDAMKRHFPGFNQLETAALDKCLKTISECDVAIEVNTSTAGELGWQPSVDILERAYFYNVKVTFGSDAHHPERVGDQFNEVKEQLKHIGFKYWCIFRGRKRESIPLD